MQIRLRIDLDEKTVVDIVGSISDDGEAVAPPVTVNNHNNVAPAPAPASAPAATTDPASATAPPPAATGPRLVETPPADADESAVELDTRGLPYDDRIHSSGRTKIKTGKNKGQWKRKKELTDDYVAEVESELRATVATGAPTSTAATDPASATAPAPAPAALTDPASATAPAPAPAPAATIDPASQTEGQPDPFRTFLKMLTPMMAAGGTISRLQVDEALATVDLKTMPELKNKPELIPQIAVMLGVPFET